MKLWDLEINLWYSIYNLQVLKWRIGWKVVIIMYICFVITVGFSWILRDLFTQKFHSKSFTVKPGIFILNRNYSRMTKIEDRVLILQFAKVFDVWCARHMIKIIKYRMMIVFWMRLSVSNDSISRFGFLDESYNSILVSTDRKTINLFGNPSFRFRWNMLDENILLIELSFGPKKLTTTSSL